MRNSKTIAKLSNNEVVRICGLGHFIPAFVKHVAHFGYDCIWLDLEHRLIDEREVQSLLQLAHLCDIDVMLRAPTLEKTRLYRYLEDGAAGLMIPHVSTPEKAQMLVDAVKFPPIGDRGYDGAGIDCDYILTADANYTDDANAQTFLVVQIETLEAVENVDAIASINGVDGLFVGPGDLGLRIKNTDTDKTVESCIEVVAAAAKKHGKAWGIPAGTPEILKQRKEQGAQLIAHGGDFGCFFEGMQNYSANFDA